MIVNRLYRALRRRAMRLFPVRSVEIDGVRIAIDPRDPVMASLRRPLLSGNYEKSERRMIADLLESSDRALDIGACIGLTSLISARKAGASNVRSYEPNPRLEALIRANFALNGLQPDLRMRAITADGRPVVLNAGSRVLYSSLKNPRVETSPVAVESDAIGAVIDEFCPTMLIIDAEGAEEEIIPATDLPGVRKVVIETHERLIGEDGVRAVIEHLLTIGFRQVHAKNNCAAFVR